MENKEKGGLLSFANRPIVLSLLFIFHNKS